MNINFTVPHTVSRQRVEDLLINAYEGGSNYWASSDGPHTQAFEPGGVDIEDVEEGDSHTLNLEALQRGLGIMAAHYPRHWANFISEDDDAETGDVFLQCCIFGEIVYG